MINLSTRYLVTERANNYNRDPLSSLGRSPRQRRVNFTTSWTSRRGRRHSPVLTAIPRILFDETRSRFSRAKERTVIPSTVLWTSTEILCSTWILLRRSPLSFSLSLSSKSRARIDGSRLFDEIDFRATTIARLFVPHERPFSKSKRKRAGKTRLPFLLSVSAINL